MNLEHRRPRPLPDVPDQTIDIRVWPSKPTEIVVVGAGGHGRELADIVRSVGNEAGTVSLLGLCDDGTPDRLALERSAMPLLGDRSALAGLNADVHLGLGYPRVRRDVDAALDFRPARPLIHPSATTGSGNSFADGVVIAQQAAVTTNIRLGRHTHINISATISHDCVLGDYVTVCPGATVTGSAVVEDMVFIGAGATILPGVRIGAGATIGAGAVIINDVAAEQIVAGIPGKPTR